MSANKANSAFHPHGVDKWVVSFISWCYNCSFSRGAPGELRVNADVVLFAGNTVWSTPERLRGEVLTTRRYTNRCLPLTLIVRRCTCGGGGRGSWRWTSVRCRWSSIHFPQRTRYVQSSTTGFPGSSRCCCSSCCFSRWIRCHCTAANGRSLSKLSTYLIKLWSL